MSFVGFMSCDDWTETEAKSFEAGNGKSAEYYENLRKWKAETDHDMSFGWFGFWSGSGVALNNCMIGLPDSIHLISVWGPWLPSTLDDAKKADMKFVQEVKGTKVMACSFVEYIGQNITPKTTEVRESWGWIWEHKTSGCNNCVS